MSGEAGPIALHSVAGRRGESDLFAVPRALARGGAPWWQWARFQRWLADAAAAVDEGRVGRDDVLAFWRGLGPRYLAETLQGRSLLKPRGYSGDFQIIEDIYDQRATVEPDLAGWDQLFQAQAAPMAVRNRPAYFAAIAEAAEQRLGRSLRIASLGCGPARDIEPWLHDRAAADTRVGLIDMDSDALTRAQAVVEGTAAAVSIQHTSLARLRLHQEQDLIWAAGLFDYFSDRLFVSSLRKLLPLVAPGGIAVIGNFSPGNPSRAYMELVCGWFLRHRTADDLTRLATEALAAAPPARPAHVRVGQEPMGVNLFLEIQLAL